MYKDKKNKYKLKYEYSTNLVGGNKDCDIDIANEHLQSVYVKKIVDLIPFERNIFRFKRSHPICSYSVYDAPKDHLYIPTPPNNNDKVFKYLDYNIRAYKIFFEVTEDNVKELSYNDILLWSNVHKKWYTFTAFPKDDNTIEKLAKDVNVDLYIDPSPEPMVDPDKRSDIDLFLKLIIGKFLLVKNKIVSPESENDTDILYIINSLLEEASNIHQGPSRVQFNTASPGYIRELEELEEFYNRK